MASLIIKLIFFFVFAHSLLLRPSSVLGDSDDENTLLQGLNSYRQTQNLPTLVKNGKADCLADQIAENMEDQPCTSLAAIPATQATQLADYPKHLEKCKIDVNSTTDGMILPVCVHSLVPSLVLMNYTHGPYAKHLNNSKFTGVGLGSEDDWMVVILSTDTPTGSFSGAASLGFGCFWFSLLLGISSLVVLS